MSIRFKSHQIKGDGIGSKQVFPTINLRVPGEDFDLETGVYAAFCTIDATRYRTALHYGPRPTFEKTANTIELYILSKNIKPNKKNQEIEVELIEKIRPIKAFATASDLKTQIKEDILKINEILNKKPLRTPVRLESLPN